jgi:hypothetical protein
MKLLAAMLFAAFVPLATAQAALIDMDSPLGPNTAVLDTSTNLEWLKLSATHDQTPNQIFAQIAPGGLLEGYRYATFNELTCGLLGPQVGQGACVQTGELRDFFEGITFILRFGKSFGQLGLFEPIFLAGHIPQVYGEIWQAGRQSGDFFINVDTQLTNLQPDRAADHWLVHQVPEPSSLALIGIAAFALATRTRRTKRTYGSY